MKYCAIFLAAFALLLGFASPSPAHRISVFAFVDGDAVQVECFYSQSRKVRQGKLIVSDLETGGKLLEGRTDDQGLFRFTPPADFLKSGHGLNILLNAGEGHQSDWQMQGEELAALRPGGAAAYFAPNSAPVSAPVAAPALEAGAGTVPSHPEQDFQAASPVSPALPGREGAVLTLSEAQLEALLNKMLDAKLAPIKQTLARQTESGPGLKDIIGGLGWILGLLGLATYLKYRR